MIPAGISRFAVRGFSASISRSAIRLKPIAANRAAVNATVTQPTCTQRTGAIALASTTPTNANGSANSVCGSFTKFT